MPYQNQLAKCSSWVIILFCPFLEIFPTCHLHVFFTNTNEKSPNSKLICTRATIFCNGVQVVRHHAHRFALKLPILLSICTWFFKFLSLKFRVWWTGFLQATHYTGSKNPVQSKVWILKEVTSVQMNLESTGSNFLQNPYFRKKPSSSNSKFQTIECQKSNADR